MIEEQNLKQGIQTTDTEKEVEHLLHSKKALISYSDLFYATAKDLGYEQRFLVETLNSFKATPNPYPIGMFLKKHSPYSEFFNHK